MPFRVLQERLIEVFTFGIPTWYTIISSATWDTIFRHSADGVTETLICLIHIRWRKSPVKFVCETNIVASLGLAKVPSLYRLAWYRTSTSGLSNKQGSTLRPGNFSKICLSGKRLSELILKNARSGLVLVFQRPE